MSVVLPRQLSFLLRYQIFILSLWQLYYDTRNKTYLIYNWLRFLKDIQKVLLKKTIIQVFILDIFVWVFPAFSRVT